MIKTIIEKFKQWTGMLKQKDEQGQSPSTGPSTTPEEPSRQGRRTEAAGSPSAAGEERAGRRRRPRRPRRDDGNRERPAGDRPEGGARPASGDRPKAPAEPWDIKRFKVPVLEGKTRFHDLELPEAIMHGVFDLGFQYCTPVQAALLPPILKGSDATGKAQTGTGKTAVFIIGALTQLLRNPAGKSEAPGRPRVLILGPTRELVIQIEKDAKDLARYTPFRTVAVFGGMDYEKQRRKLTEGRVDIVAATPGRLLDFQRQKDIRLDSVEILVIDEADRMLDMGFIPDVQHIVRSTPYKDKRQTLLFSATLTPDVTRLASQWMRDPVTVEIEPEHVAVDTVKQMVYIVTMEDKFALLYNLITLQNLKRVIVFGNRRDQTRRLAEQLERYGIRSALLSGEVDQKKRVRVLENFRAGRTRVLVATDVAARGLHIDDVSHVINYHLPLDPEDYVHRIGRTGRAGASGISISFASEDDAFQLPVIEEFIGTPLPCTHPEDDWLVMPPKPPAPAAEGKTPERGSRPGGDYRRRDKQGSSPRPRAQEGARSGQSRRSYKTP